MQPIEDVRQISAIAYGFIASKALFAALELDLFTRIEQGAGCKIASNIDPTPKASQRIDLVAKT